MNEGIPFAEGDVALALVIFIEQFVLFGWGLSLSGYSTMRTNISNTFDFTPRVDRSNCLITPRSDLGLDECQQIGGRTSYLSICQVVRQYRPGIFQAHPRESDEP